MAIDLTGKTALVTGSTSGIGRATALKLAQGGTHVIVSGRDAERGQATVDAIRTAGGRADFVAANLSDAESVRELARRALEISGGRVDILVNNAGVFPFGPTVDVTDGEFESVSAVNVRAPFILVAALAPAMVAAGAGAIINVTTMVANFGMAGMALYGSSKAALQLLTKAWAAEFGPSGVRVNAVSPGPTRTEGTVGMGEGLDQLASATPAGRPGNAEDVADAIVFLASGDARHVHGAVLPVDGGRIAV
ncbi:SDR family NAD(P)-dependent oxidoreductase [Leifsonia soli]|uniref:NAD(P)-dependent dehydrogenase (Short-subunit alcohol dehydrogenase family) n=1 Tax=Leifsonia soli TaxID=582665 RepID=A0A852T4F6_9MICO|nr:SDR family NAD(P)-dependent oxidoreductase [Leifsonia soli]NYD76067.1 NAD(P)-dependent dehydrogenase (short-subunit alcohol dehydrogenase family) [Leifsonia soli]